MPVRGILGWVLEALPGLSLTEARLLATAALVLGAVVVGALAVPVLFRLTRRAVGERLPRGPADRAASTVADRVPWRVPGRWVVRTVQAAIFLAASVGVLVVWGQLGLAVLVLAAVEGALPFLGRAVATVALVLLAYVGMDLLQETLERFSEQADRMTEHQEQVIYRVSQVALLSGYALVGLWVWDVNLGGLLVGAGFLGIVVGLAARQTLGSLIAGFVLMLSRPFEIGDWVVIGDHEGIVTDITIVNTRLRNFDGEHLSIPNDRVGDTVVINRSQEGRLRLRVEVGVDYATDPERAEAVALEAIEDLERVANQPPPVVMPTGFGDSAVALELRFWIENPNPPRKWRAIQGVVHAVKRAFEREGIKIPFPQRELAGRAETGGFRVVDVGESRTTAEEARRTGVEAEQD